MKVEYVLLADATQTAEGKLYVLGGGFSFLRQPAFPAADVALGFAISILLDFEEQGIEHSVAIRFVDDSGMPIMPNLTVSFSMAKSDVPGAAGRTILAMNGRLTLLRPGQYTMSAEAGGSTASASFHAVLASPKAEILPPTPLAAPPPITRRRRRRRR